MDVTQTSAAAAHAPTALRPPREGDLGFGKLFADLAAQDPAAAAEARRLEGQRAADLYALQELEANYAFALEQHGAFLVDLDALSEPYFGSNAQPLTQARAVQVVEAAVELLPLVYMSEQRLVAAQQALTGKMAEFEARHAVGAPVSVTPVPVDRIFTDGITTMGDLVGQWLDHLGDVYRVDALDAEGAGSWPNLAMLERAAEQVVGATTAPIDWARMRPTDLG